MILATPLRRGFLLVSVLLAFASPAFAQGGIDLSWNDCGTIGVFSRNFACNTNSGAHVLIGSAITQLDRPQVNGMTAIIDLQTNRASLSDWWQLGAGGCRQGALAADFDFTTGFFSCLDAWAGTAAGGVVYQPGIDGPTRARIQLNCATATPVAIDGTEEYYFFKITIQHTGSTGNGSCAGCTDAACIQFILMQLTQPAGVGDQTITVPAIRNFVTWQAFSQGQLICPFVESPPVGTRSPTWGSIKSLYR